MTKQYIPKNQQGGQMTWTVANKPRPMQLPLSVRMQQQQEEQAAKYNRQSSSGSGKSPGMDLEHLMKYDKANYADKLNKVNQINELQDQYNTKAAQLGSWWQNTNEAKKLRRQLSNAMVAATSDLENDYKHLEDVNKKIVENTAEDAYVQTGPRQILATNQKGEIENISYKDYHKNENRYQPIKTQDLARLRQQNPMFAQRDKDFKLTNFAGNVVYGTELSNQLENLYKTAGKESALHGVQTIAGQLTPAQKEGIAKNGANISDYETESNKQQLRLLANSVMDRTANLPESVIQGLEQKAHRRIEKYGLGENDDGKTQTYDEAFKDNLATLLYTQAKGMTESSADAWVDPRDVEKAGNEAQEDLNEMEPNALMLGILDKGANYDVPMQSAGEKMKGSLLQLENDQRTLWSPLFQGTMDSNNIHLKGNQQIENTDEFLNSTSIRDAAIYMQKVDRDGNPYQGIINEDTRQKIRDNAKINTAIKNIPKIASDYKENRDFPAEEAMQKAMHDFYQLVADEFHKELELEGEDDVEGAKEKFQMMFEVKPYLYINGYTHNEDFKTGDELGESTLNKHIGNLYEDRRFNKEAEPPDEVFSTEAYIPLSSKWSSYLGTGRKYKYYTDNKVQRQAENVVNNQRTPINLEGGKLLSFNDL